MTSVKLVAITCPIVEGLNTPEEFIAYAARVSNPGNQMNTMTTKGLLKYLIKNRHWSPFEMAHMVVEINTTRDIARQVLRHRSFSFQEFSQRYANANELGFSTREARLQDNKNRQNSLEIDDKELQDAWQELQTDVLIEAKRAYDWAINAGIAKEVARSVLPEGLTQSRLYMSGTVRSWIHYINERIGNGTQKEHRLIAEQALPMLAVDFPTVAEILYEDRS